VSRGRAKEIMMPLAVVCKARLCQAQHAGKGISASFCLSRARLPPSQVIPKLPQDDRFHLVWPHVGWLGFRNDDRVLVVQVGVAVAGNGTTGNDSGVSRRIRNGADYNSAGLHGQNSRVGRNIMHAKGAGREVDGLSRKCLLNRFPISRSCRMSTRAFVQLALCSVSPSRRLRVAAVC
jgi:hypothetical protein